MSCERMQQREKELTEKVAELLKTAEEADAAEDKLYGKLKRGDERPKELQRAETRLARIRAAKIICLTHNLLKLHGARGAA